MNKDKYYKNRYMLAFFENDELEQLKYFFNNLNEILIFQKKEINQNNLMVLKNNVYNALKSKNHVCRFLNGESLRLYIIDMKEKMK